MTDAEMHPIKVQDAPVLLERTLSPGIKLLGERLVQATDGTGTGSHSQKRLGHFAYFLGARASDEHLRQPFGNVRFIAAVALKRLRVELTFAVSGHFQILESACRGHQITGV